MNLRLSCADYSFPLLEHDHVLSLITMLGFRAVDVGLFGGRSHVRPEKAFGDVPSSARELSGRVADHGLEIATIVYIPLDLDFRTYATNNPNAGQRNKARDLFKRALEFVVRCNCAHMTTGPGIAWDGESFDVSFERDAEEMAWRLGEAKTVGVALAFEPHANSLASTPETTERMVKRVPGLTLALDYSHFVRHGIPEAEAHPLLKYTSHFHVRGATKDRLQVPFKENSIDYGRILSILGSNGYKGYVALEYVWTEWERCDEVDNLSETVLFRDYLRSLASKEAHVTA